jgi:DNA repair exonuclease SbcCD nuclease subunit
MGYCQQPDYAEKLPQILAALEQWMAANEAVDFVLHGGDMIDSTSEKNIQCAAELFRLSVPVYLCLGNHDLTCANALEMWLELAPQFFIDGPNYSIETDDCLLHVAPNQWGPEPYFWNGVQEPHFLSEQQRFLLAALDRAPEKVHLLATHSPVCGVPVGQTGYDEAFHEPPPCFAEQISELGRPHLACVLGAHSHINSHVERDGMHCITSSGFAETPFDFKLFEIEGGQVSMSTVNLLSRLGFVAEYDLDKTFVQGREVDRSFVWEKA